MYAFLVTGIFCQNSPMVMHGDGCETWTIKTAEHWRTDAFELWCWRRLFRVPWTARRSNQSILKEINPEYSLEALMLKLKLQCFGHLMGRTDSLEKTLMLERLKVGGEGDHNRGWDGWMASLTQWTWVWVNSRIWWWTGKPGGLQSMGSQRFRHDWTAEVNWAICLRVELLGQISTLCLTWWKTASLFYQNNCTILCSQGYTRVSVHLHLLLSLDFHCIHPSGCDLWSH